MRFVRGDVRDHIVTPKIDHGSSQRRYKALQRQGSLRISFREIFDAAQFSTFSTVSAKTCPHPAYVRLSVGSGLLRKAAVRWPEACRFADARLNCICVLAELGYNLLGTLRREPP